MVNHQSGEKMPAVGIGRRRSSKARFMRSVELVATFCTATRRREVGSGASPARPQYDGASSRPSASMSRQSECTRRGTGLTDLAR